MEHIWKSIENLINACTKLIKPRTMISFVVYFSAVMLLLQEKILQDFHVVMVTGLMVHWFKESEKNKGKELLEKTE